MPQLRLIPLRAASTADAIDCGMKTTTVLERLAKAASVVDHIRTISGVPSVSVGVLHHDDVLFRDSFGYLDEAKTQRPGADTTYGIGSITKSFAAASIGKLFEEQDESSVTWSSPLEEIFPDYKPKDKRLRGLVSTADFLSHRTGLLGDMSVAAQGDLEFLLPPSELLAAAANLDTVAPFRQQWLYNNWGYSMAGAVIEKLSKKPFHEYLQEAILDPLALNRTTTAPDLGDDADFADAHSTLQDGHPIALPRRLVFKNSIFESAGGLYSTVNDLLTYAKAVLRDERDPQPSLLKNIPMLLSNQVPLDSPSRDYRFYGMGWVRTQLPGVVGLQGDNAGLFDIDELPVLGLGSSPMMAYYHQGAAYGYYSALYMFPGTRSAVVVLTNSMPLNDPADWIAQVYVSALFGFSDGAEYIKLAEESRRRKLANVASMMAGFDKIRKENPTRPQPLETYTGEFYNEVGNFFIDIRRHPNKSDCLELAFQGKETQVYELRHLRGDVFEWALDYNQSARRARFAIWDPMYFEIDFVVNSSGTADSFSWAKDTDDFPQGIKMNRLSREAFRGGNVQHSPPDPQIGLRSA
ncbi:Penicillin-binding protein 4 [Colletotrichum tanaceti]|uniref:Penicillin-binding protein 4 n=1 Tax=Colletotrichum tanaceti TaxID=1306861 RepID=A0A4U6XRD4_9PEZI|nr:Penicillin-binding protein 4 [Colletotrichum tanaceti]TKW58361.1 Penicillin-binding protein 4 [Colletotrichum tanaceti]